MKTEYQLAQERAHHARLDRMAAACSERTENGEDHLHCAYCAHLCAYYNDPRARLQARKGDP